MAIKFSQFDIGTASATAYVVGYDGSSNVRIAATSLVPSSRTITINGTTYDLSANRTWTISTGPTGSGTTNYVSKWTGTTVLGNSQIFDNGTSVGIGTTSPLAAFTLDNNGAFRNYGQAAFLMNTGDAGGGNGAVGLGILPASVSRVSGERVLMIQSYYSTIRLSDNQNYAFEITLGTPRIPVIGTTNNQPFDFQTNSTRQARFFANGNFAIGTTTDGGYKLDVNGTARINGVLTFGATPTIESFGANTQIKITASTGLTISSDRWNSNTSSSSYILNGYSTKNFITTNSANGSFNSFDFSASNTYQPTIAVSYNQKLINGAMTIQSTAVANFFGLDIRPTDNSSSIANNVYAIYADATLGTNASANRWAAYFIGRGYFSGNLGVGIASPTSNLHVNGTVRVDGQRSATAGGSSGQHLIINCDGTTYKIALLNA